MKTLVFVFFFVCSLYIFSCKNHTATQMPDGGYKARTDSTTTSDTLKDNKDKAAVAVDTIKNGQAIMSGATSGSSKK